MLGVCRSAKNAVRQGRIPAKDGSVGEMLDAKHPHWETMDPITLGEGAGIGSRLEQLGPLQGRGPPCESTGPSWWTATARVSSQGTPDAIGFPRKAGRPTMT